MDDNVSRGSSSNDSLLTALDFEIIQTSEPQLNIAGNGNLDDLKRSLNEVLMDNNGVVTKPSSGNISPQHKNFVNEKIESVKVDSNRLGNENEIEIDFYAGGEHVQLGPRVTEEGDLTVFTMTPYEDDFNYTGQSSGTVTLPDGDECLLFNKVVYLGAATVKDPKSESEIQKHMQIFNSQHLEHAIEVMLLVPSASEESLVLFEPNSNVQIATFRIHRIIFCIGGTESSVANCFAFTCSQGEIEKSTLFYQCQIFKCDSPNTVNKILTGFRKVFYKESPAQSVQPIATETLDEMKTQLESVNEEIFVFDLTLEIREEDAKGNYNACPKDKNCFKIRCNLTKKIVIVLQQVSNNKELQIEKCFGLLISPGKNVQNDDMHLLENVNPVPSTTGEQKSYTIEGIWDPCDPTFEVLNMETLKDCPIDITIAMDLVIKGIQEPVRFWLETKSKIFPQNDRFWYFTRKQLVEQFHLHLKEIISSPDQSSTFEVISLKNVPQPESRRLNLSLSRNQVITTPISTPADDDTDNDEPLLSGSGDVSKDCSKLQLVDWEYVIQKWPLEQSFSQRPRHIVDLVRRGIPEPLRAEVWPRLVGTEDSSSLMEQYRTLISKDSPCEQAIQRDINRTFPAHEFFKNTGGDGQELLYKICKVYSIYDEEVGYCQGLSFLAASLLLHMPEEQTFCVLVKIMYDYQLRDLFKDNFKVLHLRFYQLEKMIEDQYRDLYNHFMNLGIEAHMYGSQWFLTLFTAKFPLFLVFHILDIFLCEGMDTIFQVALALLSMSKKDLLSLDFEGVLKYFRVALPKKFRSEETARQLLNKAVQIKTKKLKKYEKEFEILKEQERQLANPTERLERENKRLMEANMRLEQENDDLAHELVTSKIQLRNELDVSEDKADALNKELLSTKSLLIDTEEEKKRLEIEATQVKEMCRRELQRAESDSSRNSVIISEYKQICGQLSTRLEKEQTASKKAISQLHEEIKDCEKCSKLLDGTTKGSVGAQEGDPKLADALQQIRELELELAQTKLALVEAECRNQDLTHQLNSALSELQASKNTWLQKTISSIRDVTKKDLPSRESSKDGT